MTAMWYKIKRVRKRWVLADKASTRAPYKGVGIKEEHLGDGKSITYISANGATIDAIKCFSANDRDRAFQKACEHLERNRI